MAVDILGKPDTRLYDAIDDTDKIDFKPNFSLLIYSGAVLKRDWDPPVLNDGIVFTKETPPAFLAASRDRLSFRPLRTAARCFSGRCQNLKIRSDWTVA